MISIAFQKSVSWSQHLDRANLSVADEVALRYDLFLGDIHFEIDGQDFSAKWGWIPVIDFAASLLSIASQLEKGNTALEFEFTESNAKIYFQRENGNVRLTSTFVSSSASVAVAEFNSAVRRFAAQIREELLKEAPQLSTNAAFQSLLSPKEETTMQDYVVKGEWQPTDTGRVYVAKAIAKTGRVLGVVRFEVPIMDGFDMATVYGKDLSEQILVQAAEEQAHRFGKAAK